MAAIEFEFEILIRNILILLIWLWKKISSMDYWKFLAKHE